VSLHAIKSMAFRPDQKAQNRLWNDTATREEQLASRDLITNVIDSPLRQLAGNSGTYLNEVGISFALSDAVSLIVFTPGQL